MLIEDFRFGSLGAQNLHTLSPPLLNFFHPLFILVARETQGKGQHCPSPTGNQGRLTLQRFLRQPSLYALIRSKAGGYGNVMFVPSNNRVYAFPGHENAATVAFT